MPHLCNIKSPLNYVGGKYRILPQLLPLFPQRIDTFVDLFCGGCNVGVNAEARRVLFNDNLTYLVDMYEAFMRLSEAEIIGHIEWRIGEFGLSLTNAEGYGALRRLYNTRRNPLDLFVLAAYSFNHQIRFNAAHEFTTPFGRERSRYNASMERNLKLFIERLHSGDYVFSARNFEEVDLRGLGADDFVYCDPPYLIATGSYNDGRRGFTGWNEGEERKLLDLLSDLDARGVRFALSNVLEHKGRCNDLLKEWIGVRRLHVHLIEKSYANSNYHTRFNDGDTTVEVLVTNYLND